MIKIIIWLACAAIICFTHFIKQKEQKENLISCCDGCGSEFNYPIHDHFGYSSCSIECDEILEENIFEREE